MNTRAKIVLFAPKKSVLFKKTGLIFCLLCLLCLFAEYHVFFTQMLSFSTRYRFLDFLQAFAQAF
jgi:hypothetical protein